MGKRQLRLTEEQRLQVFDKTGGRCHFCGDELVFEKRGKWHGPDSGAWEADHVVQLARTGGEDVVANLLPACSECNRLRWFWGGSKLRQLLRVGHVAMGEIKKGTPLGEQIERAVEARERRNAARRVKRDSKSGSIPDDPLYEQVVQLCKEQGTVSVSMVQRTIGVGYARAARIIEAAQEAGDLP